MEDNKHNEINPPYDDIKENEGNEKKSSKKKPTLESLQRDIKKLTEMLRTPPAELTPPDIAPQNPMQPQLTDWQQYDNNLDTEEAVLMSEYDHKAHLTKARMKHTFTAPEDLLTKELNLSQLPDTEITYIYILKITAAEDWRFLGMTGLSKRRAVHLNMRLALYRSINALERILQAGVPNVRADVEAGLEMKRQSLEENKEPSLKSRLKFW